MRPMLLLLAFCFFIGCKRDVKEGSAASASASSTTGGSTVTGFSGTAAYNYAKAQVDFGPRVPGTIAAKKAGDWIINQMRSRADTVIVQAFSYKTKDGKILPLRNILAPEVPLLAAQRSSPPNRKLPRRPLNL